MATRPKAPGSPPRWGADPPSIGDLVRALVQGMAETLRRNKLPATLALVALAVVLPLAMLGRYDERPRYRQFILPEIERLESRYRSAIDRAAAAPTEVWRLYHFIDAHRSAVDVLEFLQSRRAMTDTGRRAHQALIEYYTLLDQYFAIVRTEMSLRPDMDYLERWTEVGRTLEPLHRQWAEWICADIPADS